jgi:hypothetical protein
MANEVEAFHSAVIGIDIADLNLCPMHVLPRR